MNPEIDNPKRKDYTLFWILFYFFSYILLLKYVGEVIGAITIAFFFMLIVDVIADYIQKFTKIKHRFSVLIAGIAFFGLMVYAIYSIVPISIDEGKKIYEFLTKIEIPKDENITSEILSVVVKTAGNFFNKILLDSLNYIGRQFSNLMTALILLIVASIYMSTLKPAMKKLIPRMFPHSNIEKTSSFFYKVYAEVRLFVSGQLITAFLVGLITYFGMLISGIPYAGFLGILAGITDFIPFFGVIITAIPSLLLGFSNAGIPGLIKVILVLVIANQLEMWILSPKIAAEKVKINWFLILVTMLILGKLIGIIGILISVPVLIFFKNFWDYYISEILRNT
ncbi:MAG TPA: AI-2E family transporter [Thermotogaceae bacterium]|nr:AI-2E family transporter [Thermotogota bacterium]HEW92219.1 AI-2E family transporter [Thermotogaceae bacterium]